MRLDCVIGLLRIVGLCIVGWRIVGWRIVGLCNVGLLTCAIAGSHQCCT